MLASLLPGLRDVRTPLAVGYLWLLDLWLLFGDSITTARFFDGAIIDRLSDLQQLFGQGAAVAAVSFAAFLFGSMITVRPNSFSRLWAKLTGNQALTNDGELFDFVVNSLDARGVDIQGFTAMTDSLFQIEDFRARLLVANQEMYGEFDRLETEAVFRINVAFPLFTLGAILIGRSNLQWWGVASLAVLTLLITAVLVAQGQSKNSLATEVLTRSILSGVVEHPLIVDKVAAHEREQSAIQQREIDARKSKSSRELRGQTLSNLGVFYSRLRQVEVDLALAGADDVRRLDLLKDQKEYRKKIADTEGELMERFEAE